MKISIFGLGYVGATTAYCFKALGHHVYGVDIDKRKIDLMNSGQILHYESGLQSFLDSIKNIGKIKATDDYKQAIINTDISLICVGTPSQASGEVNIDYVCSVVENIAHSIKLKDKFHVIAVRSTIPPGTIESNLVPLVEKVSGKKNNLDFSIAMNPEFLREGSAIDDFFNPERIIVGTESDRVYSLFKKMYSSSSSHKIKAKYFKVGIKTAEFTKYLDNSYHALKVAFANEIGILSRSLGIDSTKLMNLFCEDKKLNLSSYYFRPGFSYGGSCLPKDLNGLLHISNSKNLHLPILSSIEDSNNKHTERAKKLISEFNFSRIGFCGLAFKEGTDDVRGNPLLKLISYFASKKSTSVNYYDRVVKFDEDLTNCYNCRSIDELIDKSDIIVLSYKDSKIIDKLLESNKLIVDLNNVITDELSNFVKLV